MTGLLDDGVLGLASIQRCGGVAVVQDPADAAFPDMPLAALDAMRPDHVVPLSGMGAVITRVLSQPAREVPPPPDVAIHARLDDGHLSSPAELDQLGPRTDVTCPECGGPMWDVGYGRVRGYRCYLGHASGPRTLLAGQANEVERALWAAVRALQERSATFADLARTARKQGSDQIAVAYDAQASEQASHAERTRQFLLELQRGLHQEV
jgi:two-component system chemotaxis response regulator CheB